MRKATFALSVMLLSFVAVLGQAQEFQIDPVHSSATFKVKHMLVSTVVGRFTDVSGTINYDDKDPSKSSVTATIKTASVNTDNSSRDGDLKKNYFEVDKYPEMTFKSNKIEKRGDQWVASGPLTIKDVTKNVEIPVELTIADMPRGGKALGASGTFKVNRNDYHVAKSSVVDNGATVGNEITIELNVEAHPPKPADKK